MSNTRKKILVLGVDGYLGWSICKGLLRSDYEVLGVDNGLRRRLVEQVNGVSLTPISSLSDRSSNLIGQNVYFEDLDICETDKLFNLFDRFMPDIVINCAQQASAPFSMSGVQQAVLTLSNNEVGNMNVLWAMKKFCPLALYVKLGSFGEYAMTDVEVAEGYFQMEYKGQKSKTMVPFPRKSGDFYHASKSNDSNYLAVAADCWGLRIIEIMQSTIFGARIDQNDDDEKLVTRLDYDQYFGTVINRFIVQAISGLPLTVYGRGTHRTGVMSLAQAVDEILAVFDREATYSVGHNVINNSPSVDFTITDLADLVSECAKKCDLPKVTRTTIDYNGFDPRNEKHISTPQRKIATSTLVKVESRDEFADYLTGEINFLTKYAHRSQPKLINPTLNWGR